VLGCARKAARGFPAYGGRAEAGLADLKIGHYTSKMAAQSRRYKIVVEVRGRGLGNAE